MDSAQKVSFVVSISNATQSKIDDYDVLNGKSLPCHVVAVNGQIVTVAFDVQTTFTLPQVTCPIIGAEYIRFPTQIGDKGIVISADTNLGGVSGLGSGLSQLKNLANLGGLVFVPIGNKNWSSVDPNALTLYAPDGVILRDTNSGSVVTINNSGVTIQNGSNSIVVNGSGINITGTLTINGVLFTKHHHSGVTTGGSNTGDVV